MSLQSMQYRRGSRRMAPDVTMADSGDASVEDSSSSVADTGSVVFSGWISAKGKSYRHGNATLLLLSTLLWVSSSSSVPTQRF